MQKEFKYLDMEMAQGRAAFEKGYTTAEQAKQMNPYKGFGSGPEGKAEHQRFISWNRGWNLAKNESEWVR